MDIRRFRIFQAVAQEKSFTKAAQKLYMTQPAVSKAIHELEEELQLPLFERFPKKTIMTPVGEQFLQQVQQLLQLYDIHAKIVQDEEHGYPICMDYALHKHTDIPEH